MAGYLSSRQGAGAQEYGLYFKLLQRSIGGRDPAYAVAFDRCNGRYPSCSSQAAQERYRLRRRQDAFSRGVPLFGRWKNSFFSVNAFLMGNSINRFLRFVNRFRRFHPSRFSPQIASVISCAYMSLLQRFTPPRRTRRSAGRSASAAARSARGRPPASGTRRTHPPR